MFTLMIIYYNRYLKALLKIKARFSLKKREIGELTFVLRHHGDEEIGEIVCEELRCESR